MIGTKIVQVALREFKATVFTKGFVIGVLVLPVVATALMPLAFVLLSQKPPAVNGVVAVVDRSRTPSGEEGAGARSIATFLDPERIRERVEGQTRQAISKAADATGEVAPEQAALIGQASEAAAKAAGNNLPTLTVDTLPASADLEAEKAPLSLGTPFDGSRLALVVVNEHTLARGEKGFDSFDLFIKPKLDIRAQGLLKDTIREALVDARIRANGFDPVQVKELSNIAAPQAIEVTSAGEKQASPLKQLYVPLAFLMLLWISVFTSGQFLLTSTIEEKSNRVMEVLLSAVSPMELMTGKILGQMAAGMLILVLYSAMGITALLATDRSDIIDSTTLLLMIGYFVIAYLTIASMMAAVGGAVADLQEAQQLMGPIMLVIMLPLMLMFPIIFNPNGLLASILSFTPPVSPFIMVLRLSSTDPPPIWQVPVSLAVGAITVYVMVRLAAKIFRVGVLMYGKPPNFATLVRWARMA
ncbi:MAG: ABC transporter permease [Planctomycetota bacterium]|nr:ABC transporter permease [Planctomycetota bacterium]